MAACVKPFSYQEAKESSEREEEREEEKEEVKTEVKTEKVHEKIHEKVDEETFKDEEDERGKVDDDILWVKTIDAGIWFKLAHWAKVQGRFEPSERSFLFNIGKKVKFDYKYPPSISQARKARKLFEKGKRLGFIPEQ